MSEVKKMILVSSIAILALILGASGVAYSYVNNRTSASTDVSSVLIKNEDISVVFEGDSEIDASYLKDKETVSKTFTVENTSTGAINYNIVWTYIDNTYTDTDGLVYTVKDNSGKKLIENTVVPTTGANIPIIKNITLEKNEERTYTLEITYNKNKDAVEQTLHAKINAVVNELAN